MHARRFLMALLLLAGSASAQTTVTGRVTDLDTGASLRGIRVELRTPDDTTPPVARTATTNAHGDYTLARIPAGVWCLRAVYEAGPTRFSVLSPPLPFSGGRQTLHFRLPTERKDWLTHADPSAWRTKDLADITGETQEGYAADAHGTPLPGSHTVVYTQATGTLTGLVRSGPRPVPNAQVLVVELGREVRTDASGRFLVEGLAPGLYRLRITYGPRVLDVPPLEVLAGTNEVDFSL
jgi:hypothetical protein